MTASSARLGSCNRRPPLIATHKAFAQTKANPPRRSKPPPPTNTKTHEPLLSHSTTLPLKDHKNQHWSTPKPTNTDQHRNSPKLLTHTTTRRKDHDREKKGTWESKRVERMRESETVMRRRAEKKDSRRERVWVSLDLKRTDMVSFAIFWSFLLLVQTSVWLVKFTQNKIIIINI